MGLCNKSVDSNLIFRLAYDAMLKFAIYLCTKNGLRVKARQGHHVALIHKLSEYLKNEDVEIIGNSMRLKRNWDLYDGGAVITEKEADEYRKFANSIFRKAGLK